MEQIKIEYTIWSAIAWFSRHQFSFLAKSSTYFRRKFHWLVIIYKIQGSLNWNRSLIILTKWLGINALLGSNFFPCILTLRTLQSFSPFHYDILRKMSSKPNMHKSCSWDHDPEALLFNTLYEKLHSSNVIGDNEIWHLMHWGLF